MTRIDINYVLFEQLDCNMVNFWQFLLLIPIGNFNIHYTLWKSKSFDAKLVTRSCFNKVPVIFLSLTQIF